MGLRHHWSQSWFISGQSRMRVVHPSLLFLTCQQPLLPLIKVSLKVDTPPSYGVSSTLVDSWGEWWKPLQSCKRQGLFPREQRENSLESLVGRKGAKAEASLSPNSSQDTVYLIVIQINV